MTDNTIQEIKSKIDILSLVSDYVNLTKGGKHYKALCPFHNEKTPSFMVSPDLQIFRCFGCGRGGDIFTFIEEAEGVDFREALEILAEKAGVTIKNYKPTADDSRRQDILGANLLAKEYFCHILNNHPIGEKAREYLKKRGISAETIKTFELGYAPDSWESLSKFLLAKKYPVNRLVEAGLVRLRNKDHSPYDFFRGRIMFPFFGHNNSVVGFAGRTIGSDEPKYINTSETELFKKSSFLYGLAQAKTDIKRANNAIVVEGPFDVLTPFQAGTKNIVGSQGTALTLDQIRLIKRYTNNISFCFDSDIAGDAAMHRAITMAEERGINVRIINLPTDVKDADELIQKDKQIWFEAVKNAISIYDFYFLSSFRRFNRDEGTGKKQIAAELLPIVRSIPDLIEREFYLQRLSRELDIDIETLRTALSQVTTTAATKEAVVEEEKIKPFKPGVEEYTIFLLMRLPPPQTRGIFHKLGKNDFADAETRNLFEALKEAASESREVLAVEAIGAKISENGKKLFNDLYLWDVNDTLTENEQQAELQRTWVELKTRSLRRRLKDVSRTIQTAELTGNTAAIDTARTEYQALSDQLANLKEERNGK